MFVSGTVHPLAAVFVENAERFFRSVDLAALGLGPAVFQPFADARNPTLLRLA